MVSINDFKSFNFSEHEVIKSLTVKKKEAKNWVVSAVNLKYCTDWITLEHSVNDKALKTMPSDTLKQCARGHSLPNPEVPLERRVTVAVVTNITPPDGHKRETESERRLQCLLNPI